MKRLLLASLLAALPVAAAADKIELTNGHVIEADRAWFEGTQLRYQKDGGTYGIPRTLVSRVRMKSGAVLDPDLDRARERLTANDAVEATRLLRGIVQRDPRSETALLMLVQAYLALGDPRAAAEIAQRAIAVNPNSARAQELLGDALAAGGDRAGSERAYATSIGIKPNLDVERKLSEVGLPPTAPAPALPGPDGRPAAPAPRGARFRLRYDGGVNEPLGTSVLAALDSAYVDFAKRLGFRPDDPIDVVLQSEAVFQSGGTPEWAAGLNDGTIRVPVRGMDRPSEELVAVLRHELAHSFIAARTRGNCPTWLQEGLSQWLEGASPEKADEVLAPMARQKTLPSLLSLEAPFHTMAGPEAALAYAASLSGVSHIVRLRKEAGLLRLLAALSDGLPSEEALPVAMALSYPEFQQSWHEYLRTLRAGSLAPPAKSPY